MHIHSKLRGKRTGEDGFTLIELLVVVVIIGVLIAIAIPTYLSYKKSASDKAAQSDVRNAISVMETCNTENSTYPTAATQSTTSVALTGCTTQSLKLSDNTTFSYSATSPTVSYKMVAQNSGGSGKIWCYNSANGGSVKDVSSATVTTVAGGLTAC